MISLKEIKERIEKSENPIYFFDDDPDGLVSYILLKRRFDKGEGIVIKTKPMNYGFYFKKIEHYKPDLIVILDKPVLTQDFIDKINVPVIWIDHHPVINLEGVRYFNPLLRNKKDNRPVSYWCYRITRRDLWIATVGVLGDWCLATFKEFKKKYPELVNEELENADEILYNTKIGELVRIFSFILKGNAEEVMRYVDILCKINEPEEILERKSEHGKIIFEKAEDIRKKYEEILEEALKSRSKEGLLVFTYYSRNSFSGDLANELLYRFPNKVILVAREKNEEMKISLRSKNIKLPEIIKKALGEMEGHGGGHEFACGANIAKRDFKRFVEILKNEIN